MAAWESGRHWHVYVASAQCEAALHCPGKIGIWVKLQLLVFGVFGLEHFSNLKPHQKALEDDGIFAKQHES